MKNKINVMDKIILGIFISIPLFFVIGVILLLVCITVQTKQVTVIEENKNNIKVQLDIKLGDPIIYEMKKQLFFSPKKGDKIFIIYDEKKPEKIHYFIDTKILEKLGTVLIRISVFTLICFVICLFGGLYFYFSYLSLKKVLLNDNINYVKKIFFVIGVILMPFAVILMFFDSDELIIIGMVLWVLSCLIIGKYWG